MKKQCYTLIAFILSSAITLKAQTLTEGAFPVAGNAFTLTLCDTAGFNTGATGTGVSWNYASLTASGKTQYDTFMDPANTPYAALVPTATVADYEVIDTARQYIYYNDNTGQSAFQRLANILPDTVIYSVEGNQFPYPLSYGSPFSGSYYAKYHDHTSGLMDVEAGTVSGSADGTGTLTTPLGTFSNVIRTHFTRNENDTLDNGALAATSVYEYYSWYQPNSYYPIMEYLTSTYNFSGHNLTTISLGYRMGYSSTAINNTSADNTGWMVYPNPASNQASVIFQPAGNGKTLISLYDMQGRTVQQLTADNNAGTVQTMQLNLENMPAGIYMVRIENNNARAIRKLEIAR